MAGDLTLTVVRVEADLPVGFAGLREEAHREGYTHMERLAADWTSGADRFAAADEALLAALAAGELAGIGGMTIDQVDAGALRMRRFHVRPRFRGQGAGRRLADALLAQARMAARRVVLNATTEQAVRFWEGMGFVPDRCDGHTHSLPWPDG